MKGQNHRERGIRYLKGGKDLPLHGCGNHAKESDTKESDIDIAVLLNETVLGERL